MPSPIIVTATLFDPGNNLVQGNAFIRFRLRNFDGWVPVVSGTGLFVETQIDAFPDSSGAVSTTLWGNSSITPGPDITFYTVEAWDNGRITSSGNYQFDGNTNLNTASQLNPAPVPTGPSTIIFENNGALNSSQTTLNLENTDGSLVITDEGGGTLNLTVPAQGATFSGVGGAEFVGPGITAVWMSQNQQNVQLPGDAATYVFKFVLDSTWVLTRCSYVWFNNLTGPISFVLYDHTGAKIANTDNWMNTGASGPGANTPTTNPLTAATLAPGVYYFAYASSGGSGLSVPGLPLQFSSTSGTAVLGVLNATAVFIGTAANSRSVNAMPATLGALTAYTNANIIMPCPVWST